jgi:thermostable 8-oxoguanine DNA glycosylase
MKSTTISFSTGKLDDQRNFMNKSFKEKVNALEKISEKSKDADLEFAASLKILTQSVKEINEIKSKEKILDSFVNNLEKELIQDLKKYKSSP